MAKDQDLRERGLHDHCAEGGNFDSGEYTVGRMQWAVGMFGLGDGFVGWDSIPDGGRLRDACMRVHESLVDDAVVGRQRGPDGGIGFVRAYGRIKTCHFPREEFVLFKSGYMQRWAKGFKSQWTEEIWETWSYCLHFSGHAAFVLIRVYRTLFMFFLVGLEIDPASKQPLLILQGRWEDIALVLFENAMLFQCNLANDQVRSSVFAEINRSTIL